MKLEIHFCFCIFLLAFRFCTDYPTQYNRNPTPKYVQTTYRPSTVTIQTQSTSAKTVAPSRETYVNSKPSYDQPSQVYNPEYDETLVSQVSRFEFEFFKRKKKKNASKQSAYKFNGFTFAIEQTKAPEKRSKKIDKS